MSVVTGPRREIILAGMGGQGLVFLGKVLGDAAVLGNDMHAAVTQSYGIATRGGFTKSEVILSATPIAYPRVMEPHAVLALTQQALDLYQDGDAWLIYDSDAINGQPGPRSVGLPFTSMAREHGLLRSINVMGLGAMVEILDLLSRPSVSSVLGEGDSGAARANVKAFEIGCILGREHADGGE